MRVASFWTTRSGPIQCSTHNFCIRGDTQKLLETKLFRGSFPTISVMSTFYVDATVLVILNLIGSLNDTGLMDQPRF